jgi:aquaporin Z
MNKYIAETIGTFLLVFFGTLAITQSGGDLLHISLAFGGTLVVVITLIGGISGAHVNPAVSFGAWVNGKLSTHDLVPYWIAQCIGAILGSLFVMKIVGSGPIGETTFSLSPEAAFLTEALLTFFFVLLILTVVEKKHTHAAVIIGGALFLIHLAAIPLTGASVNPARSLGPVVVAANSVASSQIWIYIAGPLLGGALAGALKKHIS